MLAIGTSASAPPPERHKSSPESRPPASDGSTSFGFTFSYNECEYGSLVGKTVAELRAAGVEISNRVPDDLVPVPPESPGATADDCAADHASLIDAWSVEQPEEPELDDETRESLLAARSALRRRLRAAQRAAETGARPSRLRFLDVAPIELWSDEGGQFIVDDSNTAWNELSDPYDTVLAALERNTSAAAGDGFFWLTPSAQFAKVRMRFELWTGPPPAAAKGDFYQAKVWFYGRHLEFQDEGSTLGRYLTLDRPGRYWVRLTRQGGTTSYRTGRETWLLQFWPAT